jgi:hypothetical protein
MSDLCRLIWCALIGLFRPRAALEAEILVLRHQLNVLRRKSPKRVVFGNVDRLVFTALYRVAPGVLDALKILKPQTVIRWHHAGFRAYWRWKSRPRGGRPKTPADIRQLIRDMSVANPLWGAPRIHGELLKLGIDVGQTTVAKYMARRRQPPSQGWKTFLRNHADGITSMDFFVRRIQPSGNLTVAHDCVVGPRGPSEVSDINGLARGLGEKIAIDIQELSDSLPKPLPSFSATLQKPDLIVDPGDLPATARELRDLFAASGRYFDRGVPVKIVSAADGGAPTAIQLTCVYRKPHSY